MESPVEYAQKMDALLRDADNCTADAALTIARALFEHRKVMDFEKDADSRSYSVALPVQR